MATIIKHDAPARSTGTRVRGTAYDFADMAGQAEAYLDEVRREAAKIIQEAKQESAEIRTKAEQVGRQAAEEAVEAILDEKVAKQMRSLTPALAKAAQQIEDSRQDWLRHWESAVVHLACEIAARIVRREIAQNPDISLEWISEALRLCAGAGTITVRLHPDDHKTLGSQVERLAESFCAAAETAIVADEAITSGGCRVETRFGSIDAQIETQLQRIEQELS